MFWQFKDDNRWLVVKNGTKFWLTWTIDKEWSSKPDSVTQNCILSFNTFVLLACVCNRGDGALERVAVNSNDTLIALDILHQWDLQVKLWHRVVDGHDIQALGHQLMSTDVIVKRAITETRTTVTNSRDTQVWRDDERQSGTEWMPSHDHIVAVVCVNLINLRFREQRRK